MLCGIKLYSESYGSPYAKQRMTSAMEGHELAIDYNARRHDLIKAIVK